LAMKGFGARVVLIPVLFPGPVLCLTHKARCPGVGVMILNVTKTWIVRNIWVRHSGPVEGGARARDEPEIRTLACQRRRGGGLPFEPTRWRAMCRGE
jgi:hypothetical protein